MATEIVQILNSFLQKEFWHTGISSSRFWKWPWILNWRKWILLVDIPVQILLTIMGSIDFSSRCKLDIYVIAHTPKWNLAQKLLPFARFVRQLKSKEWVKAKWECLLLICIYFNSKFEVTSKNAGFDCWYIGTHTKEKPSKISNIKDAILLLMKAF